MNPTEEQCGRRDDDGKWQTRRRQEDVELTSVWLSLHHIARLCSALF